MQKNSCSKHTAGAAGDGVATDVEEWGWEEGLSVGLGLSGGSGEDGGGEAQDGEDLVSLHVDCGGWWVGGSVKVCGCFEIWSDCLIVEWMQNSIERWEAVYFYIQIEPPSGQSSPSCFPPLESDLIVEYRALPPHCDSSGE